MEQVAQTVIEYKAAIVALWLLLFLGAERLLPPKQVFQTLRG